MRQQCAMKPLIQASHWQNPSPALPVDLSSWHDRLLRLAPAFRCNALYKVLLLAGLQGKMNGQGLFVEAGSLQASGISTYDFFWSRSDLGKFLQAADCHRRCSSQVMSQSMAFNVSFSLSCWPLVGVFGIYDMRYIYYVFVGIQPTDIIHNQPESQKSP